MSLLAEIEEVVRRELGPPAGWPAVADLRIGVYLAGAVLEDGSAGLAYVSHGERARGQCCPLPSRGLPEPGSFCERAAFELLALRGEDDPLLWSASMAVLNALCNHVLVNNPRPQAFDAAGAPADPFELLHPEPDDVVSLVGAMTPYLVRLEGRVRELYLFERDSSMVRDEHRRWLRREEEAAELLGVSTLVIITGSALANGSLDGLLPMCGRAREVAVVGPTASVVPEPLFERGVSVLGGVEVTAPAVMMRVISEGGSGRALDSRCVRKRTFRRPRL